MPKRNSNIEIPNLLAATFTQIKRIAREACTKTDQELSEETGIPRSTIASALSNPEYHPSIPNTPGVCKALGNNLILEWPVAQIGGIIVFPPTVTNRASIQHTIAKLSKEFADVIEQDARAVMKDSPGGSARTDEERSRVLHELAQLSEAVETAKLVYGAPRNNKKR